MADGHHVLLLWHYILGLCLPPVFFVSVSSLSSQTSSYSDRVWASLRTDRNSMRYSRMLEESSFANRKADYFWLLFLSSLMLLVRLPLHLQSRRH